MANPTYVIGNIYIFLLFWQHFNIDLLSTYLAGVIEHIFHISVLALVILTVLLVRYHHSKTSSQQLSITAKTLTQQSLNATPPTTPTETLRQQSQPVYTPSSKLLVKSAMKKKATRSERALGQMKKVSWDGMLMVKDSDGYCVVQ